MRARFRPSHGTVVAYLALFVALGGTTYAATGGNFILGQPNTASTATQLSSGAASALKLTNTAGGNGVLATGGSVAKNASAVNGNSTAGNGVQGISGANSASGVYGQNNSSGYGVAGRSANGTGVLGDSSAGWAFNASGNATQSRNKGGFVKAMAYVDPGVTPHIVRCFNSQLPASQATSGTCGITYSSTQAGVYTMDFGFQVSDRFMLAQIQSGAIGSDAVLNTTSDPSQETVYTTNYLGNTSARAFYIVVF